MAEEKIILEKPERVTTKQAALELNMGIDTLQFMMQQKRLPIGYAIKREGKKRWAYFIYRGLLDSFKLELEGASDKFAFLYGQRENNSLEHVSS